MNTVPTRIRTGTAVCFRRQGGVGGARKKENW